MILFLLVLYDLILNLQKRCQDNLLHGDLDEDIYMTQQVGFLSAGKEENLVCKMKKSLYGLKQAPKECWANLVRVLISERSLSLLKILRTKSLAEMFTSDFLLEEVDAFLALDDDPTSPEMDQYFVDTEGDILLLEAFLNDDPSFPPPNQGNYLPKVHKELKMCKAKSDKSSIDEPLEVKLKDLPLHLEYAFLEGDEKLPVIIAKDLSVEEKTALITSDNGTEFKNATLKSYYEKLGILHHTSIARMHQQNGVVECKNRTLVEAARTMLIFSKLPKFLLPEAISTTCFTQNCSLIHTRYNKTPYELIKGRKSNVQYYHVFGSLCYQTNDRDGLAKMKPKADIGVFVGYFESSTGFHIHNR
nr:retrovirus-related Pol polyprotein from transposon TNT 1-94 [Tanacetum cinerariifolium]